MVKKIEEGIVGISTVMLETVKSPRTYPLLFIGTYSLSKTLPAIALTSFSGLFSIVGSVIGGAIASFGVMTRKKTKEK